jgi:hypothetical protein
MDISVKKKEEKDVKYSRGDYLGRRRGSPWGGWKTEGNEDAYDQSILYTWIKGS